MDFPVQFCGISCIWDFQSVLLWFDCLSVPCLSLHEGWGKKNERGATNSVLFNKSLLELPCRQMHNFFKLFYEAFCLVSSKYREKKRDKEKKRKKRNRIGFTLQASSRCLVSPAHNILSVTVRLSRYCAVHRLAGNNLTWPSFRCSE